MLLINARSLKKPNALIHLHTDMLEQNVDICLVSESWLGVNVDYSFMLPGYHLERHDRSHKNSNKQTGGGVCAFIRHNLSYAQLYPLGSDLFEILWLDFFISPRVLLCLLYFPPDAYNAEAVSEHIFSTVENSMQNTAYGCIVVCGDLNSLDTGHISTHCNLHLVNTDSTSGARNLDKFLCDDPSIFQCCKTFPLTISSDHLGVIANIAKSKHSRRKIVFRDQRVQFKRPCNLALDQCDFSQILHTNEVNQVVSELSHVLTSYFNHFCSLRRVSLRNTEPPFVTPVVKLLLKKNNKLFKKRRFNDALAVAAEIRHQIFSNLGTNKREANLGGSKSTIM